MSFDIYIIAFQDGGEGKIDRSIAERCFSSLVPDTLYNDWGIYIPPHAERCFGTVSIDETAEIANFSVNRPPSAPEFWDALFEVMRQTLTIIFWPSGKSNGDACAVNPNVIPHVPSDILESYDGIPLIKFSSETEYYIYNN